MVGTKFDYAPLLAPGRHYRRLSDLDALCVQPYPKSRTRTGLYEKLCEFVSLFDAASIRCKILVNGSFVTAKIDPSDVDVAVLIEPDVAEYLNDQQQELIYAINENYCIDGIDGFVETLFPIGHRSFRLDGNEMLWSEQYGREHNGEYLKGIVVLRLGETDVGLRIRR